MSVSYSITQQTHGNKRRYDMDAHHIEIVVTDSAVVGNHPFEMPLQESMLTNSVEQVLYAGPGGPLALYNIYDLENHGRRPQVRPQTYRWFTGVHESTLFTLGEIYPRKYVKIDRVWLAW